MERERRVKKNERGWKRRRKETYREQTFKRKKRHIKKKKKEAVILGVISGTERNGKSVIQRDTHIRQTAVRGDLTGWCRDAERLI